MVQAAEARPQNALSRQSVFPLLLGVLYLVLLLAPWVLTCVLAQNPDMLGRSSKHDVHSPTSKFYVDYSVVTAIEVLDAVAVVVSLPVLSALLARAAVVFSQRRNKKRGAPQKLTVRQLFALADRGWWNLLSVLDEATSSLLLVLGWFLLLVAFLLPIVRSTMITHVSAVVSTEKDLQSLFDSRYSQSLDNLIGYSPDPGLLKGVSGEDLITNTRTKLQTTSGGLEGNLWPYCNDETNYYNTSCGYTYAPYDINQSNISNYWEPDDVDRSTGVHKVSNGSALMFASSVQAGSTTGLVNNGYALGLKSGTTCKAVTVEEVTSSCITAAHLGGSGTSRGWNTSLVIPGQVRVDICLPVYESTSIWDRAGSPSWQPQTVSEDIYIGVQELNDSNTQLSDWDCSGCLGTNTSPAGLYIYCQANTTLAYFQLGNMSTDGVPSPFLNDTPSTFSIPKRSVSSIYDSDDIEPQAPLMTASQAMFGNDSWLAMVGSLLNLTDSIASADLPALTPLTRLLCQMQPLANAAFYFSAKYYEPCYIMAYDLEREKSPAQFLGSYVRAFFSIFQSLAKARAVLNTGTFFANDAILAAATSRATVYDAEYNKLYRYDGLATRPVVPVVSTTALAAVSALVALQCLGVLLLLACAYSARVWTRTLDAFAVARVGAQLARLDADGPGALGVGAVSEARARKLWARDGLIDTRLAAAAGAAAGAGEEDGVFELGLLPPPYSPRDHEPGSSDAAATVGPGDAVRRSSAGSSSASAYEPGPDRHGASESRDGEVVEGARADRVETSSSRPGELGVESGRHS